MIFELAICVGLGALLWLDRVYVFLAGLNRPIVLAPLIGLCGGEVELGLMLGAALELLWLNAPPVGSFLPPDDSFCAAVCVPLAVYAAGLIEPRAAAGLALCLGLPTALVGRRVDIFIRQRNNVISYAGQEACGLEPKLFKALAQAFLVCLATLAVCVAVLLKVESLLIPRLAPAILKALGCMPLAALVIGLAAVAIRDRRRTLEAGLFSLGLLLGFMLILKG